MLQRYSTVVKHGQSRVRGGGGGAVGRAVGSNTRDPPFESSHWQFCIKTVLKKENKGKRALG